MKFFSLLRAVFSDGLNLTNYRTKPTDTKLKRLVFPVVIIILIALSIGYLTYTLIDPLAEQGQTALIPMFLIVFLSLLALLEGIYKTPSTLFDCKDNDLLLSLPIPKSQVFTLRVVKLLAFQFAFNALFMLPAFAAYALRLAPDFNFYLVSILMLFLIPLLPTAISVALGYLVKAFSLGFQHKKLAQTILTFVFLMATLLIIGNWQSIALLFAEQGTTISDIVGTAYYPAGAYARLLVAPHLGDFLGLLASTILPLVVVIYLCSLRYFKIISKNTASDSPKKVSNHKNLKTNLKSTPKTLALVKKEITQVISPVFLVNTLFGPVLLLFITILAGVNLDMLLNFFVDAETEAPLLTLDDISLFAPLFYLGALTLMCAMTSITSSMISLEGKSFNLTKSLPLPPQQILKGKLLASLTLALPLFLLADLCFILEFHPAFHYALLILILPFLALTLTGTIGLLMNLKYPKLDAASDAEVVKQSASSLISTILGLIFGLASVALLVALSIFTSLDAPLILTALFLLADLILLKILNTHGAKKFKAITI